MEVALQVRPLMAPKAPRGVVVMLLLDRHSPLKMARFGFLVGIHV